MRLNTPLAVLVSAGLVLGVSSILGAAQFPSELTVVARWGHANAGGPTAIAVDRRSGAVYVLEQDSTVVRKFSAAGELTAVWQVGTPQGVPGRRIAVDGEGSVYITDPSTNSIRKLGPSGELLATWALPPASRWPIDRLWMLGGIAVDRHDQVYIVHTGTSRVLKLDSSGTLVSEWPAPEAIREIAVGRTGDIYLAGASLAGSRVTRLSQTGTLVASWDFLAFDGRQFPGVVQSLPSGIAVDDQGHFFVADKRNHRVLKFSDDGHLLRVWGWKGRALGAFHFAWFAGIALDSTGNVLVADSENYRVERFTPDGILRQTWKGFAGEGQLRLPNGVALSPNGRLYVADTRNHRIAMFDTTGRYLGAWGSFGRRPGELIEPWGIAVDRKGNVYVGEVGNRRVQKFDSDGKFLATWPERRLDCQDRPCDVSGHWVVVSSSDVLYVDSYDPPVHKIHRFTTSGKWLGDWSIRGTPLSMTLDAQGYIHMTVSRHSTYGSTGYSVQKFDSNGRQVGIWGSPGRAEDELFAPTAIAVDAEGNTYLSAIDLRNSRRIKKFDSAGRLLFSWPPPESPGGAGLACPEATILDGAGHMYIAEPCSHSIIKLAIEGQ